MVELISTPERENRRQIEFSIPGSVNGEDRGVIEETINENIMFPCNRCKKPINFGGDPPKKSDDCLCAECRPIIEEEREKERIKMKKNKNSFSKIAKREEEEVEGATIIKPKKKKTQDGVVRKSGVAYTKHEIEESEEVNTKKETRLERIKREKDEAIARLVEIESQEKELEEEQEFEEESEEVFSFIYHECPDGHRNSFFRIGIDSEGYTRMLCAECGHIIELDDEGEVK